MRQDKQKDIGSSKKPADDKQVPVGLLGDMMNSGGMPLPTNSESESESSSNLREQKLGAVDDDRNEGSDEDDDVGIESGVLTNAVYYENIPRIKKILEMRTHLKLQKILSAFSGDTGLTPFLTAVKEGKMDAARMLLHPAGEEYNSDTARQIAVEVAAENNQIDILKMLVDFIITRRQGDTALRPAVASEVTSTGLSEARRLIAGVRLLTPPMKSTLTAHIEGILGPSASHLGSMVADDHRSDPISARATSKIVEQKESSESSISTSAPQKTKPNSSAGQILSDLRTSSSASSKPAPQIGAPIDEVATKTTARHRAGDWSVGTHQGLPIRHFLRLGVRIEKRKEQPNDLEPKKAKQAKAAKPSNN